MCCTVGCTGSPSLGMLDIGPDLQYSQVTALETFVANQASPQP